MDIGKEFDNVMFDICPGGLKSISPEVRDCTVSGQNVAFKGTLELVVAGECEEVGIKALAKASLHEINRLEIMIENLLRQKV